MIDIDRSPTKLNNVSQVGSGQLLQSCAHSQETESVNWWQIQFPINIYGLSLYPAHPFLVDHVASHIGPLSQDLRVEGKILKVRCLRVGHIEREADRALPLFQQKLHHVLSVERQLENGETMVSINCDTGFIIELNCIMVGFSSAPKQFVSWHQDVHS